MKLQVGNIDVRLLVVHPAFPPLKLVTGHLAGALATFTLATIALIGTEISVWPAIASWYCSGVVTLAAVMWLLTAAILVSDPGLIMVSEGHQLQWDVEDSLGCPSRSQELTNICDECGAVQKHWQMVHCDDCDCCILGMDHHCPWIGKCVGAGNWWLFWSWIVSIFAYMILGMVLFILGLLSQRRMEAKL